MDTDLLTPDQTAAILGVSRSRVRQFVRDKELTTEGMFGSVTMFSRKVVLALKGKRESKSNGAKRGPKPKLAPKK